jgi:uncharacterized protein
MAFENFFSDIDIELTQQSNGDVLRDIDVDAIKNSIGNILTTAKGSRRMLPEFGADIKQYLFEPMDLYTAQKIGNTMLIEIEKWENRVIIDNIDVAANYEHSQYNITISFHIRGLGQLGSGVIKFILKQT